MLNHRPILKYLRTKDSNPGNEGWPKFCSNHWMTYQLPVGKSFRKMVPVSENPKTIWRQYCAQCTKKFIIQMSSQYNRNSIMYSNLVTDVKKAIKALKQYYGKYPELALEE